jgi:hypothetical protein
LKVVAARFGDLPAEITGRIESTTGAGELEALLERAAVCPDLGAFLKTGD